MNAPLLVMHYKNIPYYTGAISVSNAHDHFSEGLSPGVITNVNCSGTETDILKCEYEFDSQGFSCDTAGVVCQGIICATCI